jgi:hypothetical protein
VLVKDLPNGSAVPPNATASASPAPTGPDGAPRYYVALEEPGGNPDKPYQIVVGDSVTGSTLATFAAPKNTAFRSVTAAADDLTFVVSAVTSANESFRPGDEGTVTGRWYAVRLAPGTANPVSTSASGDTIIAAWNTYAKGTLTDAVGGLHIGVISHGKFTPLRFPRGFTQSGSSTDIAW